IQEHAPDAGRTDEHVSATERTEPERVCTAVQAVRWLVPGLIERPAVGTSCCASTAEALVAQELSMLPGVRDVAIDGAAAVVAITFQPDTVDEATLVAALGEIGYPPSLTEG
ncbi:MAG: heavy-metal-associated domain-containing protein, partial [Chloroflexota bacterium]